MGLDQVPEHLQGSVDGMLTHLVGNAVEHGIEAAEQRLAAGKRAAGTLTVQIAAGDANLELSVQDDGQGFDTDKLGRAAVARGLLTEDTLQRTEARSLIGLIFRPGFSTATGQRSGRGLGMEFLRELVARLDGRITVATKSRRVHPFPHRAAAASTCTTSARAERRVSQVGAGRQGVATAAALTTSATERCNARAPVNAGHACIWSTRRCSSRRPAVA